jgi:hypothetical protein
MLRGVWLVAPGPVQCVSRGCPGAVRLYRRMRAALSPGVGSYALRSVRGGDGQIGSPRGESVAIRTSDASMSWHI